MKTNELFGENNMIKILFLIFFLSLLTPIFTMQKLNVEALSNSSNYLDSQKNVIEESCCEPLNGIKTNYYADGTDMPSEKLTRFSETPGVLNGLHPFTNNVTKLFDVNEIAIVPYTHDGQEACYLIDDALATPDPFQPMETLPWTVNSPEYILEAHTGDFNADGHDEIITVDDDGYVKIMEYQTLNGLNIVVQTAYDLNALESGDYANIAVANFNEDPGDEFVISCGERERLHIWDPWNDVTETYYQPGSQGDTPSVGNGFMSVYYDSGLNQPVKITTSDVNGNGIPDIITVGESGHYYAIEYDYIQNDWEELAHWDTNSYPYPFGFGRPDTIIGTGDVDGDIKPDIVTMGLTFQGDYPLDFIYENTVTWSTYTTNGMEELNNETAFGINFVLVSVNMGDIDGDELSETVAVGMKFENPSLMGDYSWETFVFDDKRANFQRIAHFRGNECPWVQPIFIFTDIDSDGADEIIFSSEKEYDGIEESTYIVDYNAETLTFSTLTKLPTKAGFVAAGDFDNDGITCEYLGNHGKRISPSMPLFVLAAPPAYKGINDDGCETSISTEESTSSSHSDQFTVSAGIKFSYGNSFKIFKQGIDYKISVGVSYEFAKTQTTTTTTTHGVKYATGFDDNYVVFHAVEYESYLYTVVTHPDNDSIGSIVSIDVPIQTNIFKAPVKYYNNINATTPIGMETFIHTVGKPGTYPTKQEALLLNPTYISAQPKAVSLGNGSDSIFYTSSIEETVSYEHSVSLEASVEFESEFASGTYGLEFSFGVGYGHGSENTIGSTMAYEATVSDIGDEEHFEKYNYDWGIFLQTIYRPDGSRYKLVHYYTEGEFPPEENDLIGDIGNIISEGPVNTAVIAVVGYGVISVILGIIKRKK